MTILALAPMALIQATTLNADAIHNGGCFLFIAWILHLSFSTTSKYFTRNELIVTCLMIFLLFSLKTSAFPLILLLFLIPAKKFKNLMQKLLFISITLTLFLVLGVGWNIIATSQIKYGAMPVGSDFLNQTKYILTNPLKFLMILISDPVIHADKYLTQWMGVFPTGYWEMPALVYFLFPISLFLAWLLDRSQQSISLRIRFNLFILFLISFFATILIIYISFTPVGTVTVPNIYGRYFLGITPLLFLAITQNASVVRKEKQRLSVIMLSISATLLITALGMFLSYHIPCGMWYYTPGKCYMPQYKNWNPAINNSIALQKGISINQNIESGCNDFDGIRLWTFNRNIANSSSIFVELKELHTDKVIASKNIPPEQIKNNNWLEIAFPKIPDSFHQRYVIHISTTSPKDDIQLALGEPNEYRFDLFVNNKLIERDLLFQQRCALGLNNLLELDKKN